MSQTQKNRFQKFFCFWNQPEDYKIFLIKLAKMGDAFFISRQKRIHFVYKPQVINAFNLGLFA